MLRNKGIGDIDRALEALTEKPLSLLVDGVHDQWKVEVEGKPIEPIVADVAQMKSALGRLFEARHVLVHEMPKERPFKDHELLEFAIAAHEYSQATDQAIVTLLYGRVPYTQLEMNEEAHAKANVADASMTELLTFLDPNETDDRLQQAQSAWTVYREHESVFMSRMDLEQRERGSIAPLIYWTTWEELTKERTKWMSNSYGEGWGAVDWPAAKQENETIAPQT